MLIVLLVGTPVVAGPQLPAPATQPAERQPIVRETLALGGEPLRPAGGWALTTTGEIPADAVVSASGVGTRITSITDLTVFRPDWRLSGTFAVAATFQAESPSAIYGLTVGSENGLAFAVRGDGGFRVQALSGGRTSGGSWALVALREPGATNVSMNRLEVRVGSSEAAFLVNGQKVQVVPITPGQLDGVPGVHVGAGGNVILAGFTIEGVTMPALRGDK
jgi:hypothetical protein